MKHFYASVLALLSLALNVNAAEVQLTLTIDNNDAAYVNYNNNTYNFTDGTLNLTVEEYSNVTVNATDGNLIATVNHGYNSDVYSQTYSFYPTTYDTAPYAITTITEADFYDAECTLKWDDASKFGVALQPSYRTLTIPTDTNQMTVKYSTTRENYMNVYSQGAQKIYSVTANGEEKCQNGNAYISLEPGMVIDVTTAYPDVDVALKFVFTNPDTEGVISELKINGDSVDPATYTSDAGGSVKLGSTISITYNTTDYKINSTLLNGAQIYAYTQYSGQVLEASTFTIDATRYATVTKTIDVEGAEHFTFYRGYSYENNVVELHNGSNSFDFNTNNSYVSIKVDPGYYLSELTDNGQSLLPLYGESFSLGTDGSLVIAVKEIAYDDTLVVYIDDRQAPTQYFSFQNYNRQDYGTDFTSGYNTVKFYAGDCPMQTSWYECPFNNLYVNNVKQQGRYGQDSNYELNPANNDVVKIFWASDPEFLDLEFVNSSEQAVSGTMDLVTPLTDLNTVYSVLPGTIVKLSAPEGNTLKVQLGDAAPTEATEHKFQVEAGLKVTISDPSSSGVDNVAVEAADADTPVYNLQGVRVASKTQFDRLPKGIYIIDGVKTVK